jgi:ceramide glucosyltransferase
VTVAAHMLGLVAALWWACAVGGLLASFVAALCFPWPRRSADQSSPLPAVSAIVPIKELDAGFEAAQSSLFRQAYEKLDIVIASAEGSSPAVAAARDIAGRHSHVPSRIVQSPVNRAASPKLNNLWTPIAQADSDVILTKDSNILLSPGDVECFVRHLQPGVGVVSAIPIAIEPRSFAAWVESSFINNFYARILMFARAAGLGFNCGKIMLFRRSDVERAGGLERLAWALGEDAALSDALARLGLRTVLADRVTHQPLGRRRWAQIWDRQLRWRLIWRVQAPAVFAAALVGSAVLAALAGALAAHAFGYSPTAVAAATLILWFCLETSLGLARGWPVSFLSPIAFLGRELIDAAVWVRALTTSEVGWSGIVCRAGTSYHGSDVGAKLKPAISGDAVHDA